MGSGLWSLFWAVCVCVWCVCVCVCVIQKKGVREGRREGERACLCLPGVTGSESHVNSALGWRTWAGLSSLSASLPV